MEINDKTLEKLTDIQLLDMARGNDPSRAVMLIFKDYMHEVFIHAIDIFGSAEIAETMVMKVSKAMITSKKTLSPTTTLVEFLHDLLRIEILYAMLTDRKVIEGYFESLKELDEAYLSLSKYDREDPLTVVKVHPKYGTQADIILRLSNESYETHVEIMNLFSGRVNQTRTMVLKRQFKNFIERMELFVMKFYVV